MLFKGYRGKTQNTMEKRLFQLFDFQRFEPDARLEQMIEETEKLYAANEDLTKEVLIMNNLKLKELTEDELTEDGLTEDKPAEKLPKKLTWEELELVSAAGIQKIRNNDIFFSGQMQ